jgi:hypothetical protein
VRKHAFSRLPDGTYIFKPKSLFGYILENLGMKNVGIFYLQLAYLTAIWYIFGHLVHFVVIWYIFPVLVCFTNTNLATLRLFQDCRQLIITAQPKFLEKILTQATVHNYEEESKMVLATFLRDTSDLGLILYAFFFDVYLYESVFICNHVLRNRL